MAPNTRTLTVNVVGNASGATKAMGEAGAAADKTGSQMSGAFKGAFSAISTASGGAFAPIQEALSGLGPAMDALSAKGKTVGSVMVGAGVGIAGAGAALTAFGDKDKAASQQLGAAVAATGQDIDDYSDRIEKTIKAQEKYGSTASTTTDAIRILTQSTGDTGKALDLMGTAANLAAAKHISLSAAATTLAKVNGGATKTLKEFGIATEKAGDNTKTLTAAEATAKTTNDALGAAVQAETMLHARLAGKIHLTVAEQQSLTLAHQKVTDASAKDQAAHEALAKVQVSVTTKTQAATDNLDALGKKLNGQASAAADTFTGHMKALKTEIEDQAAQIGQKYGPALMGAGAGISLLGTAATGAQKVMGLFKKTEDIEKTTKEALTAATALETVGIEAETAAETASIVPEWLTLGPVLLIIAAIALLGVGIYELVTHWKTVWSAMRDAVKAAVDFMENLIATVVHWIKGHWMLLVAILTGPIGIAVLLIKDHFNEIVSFITGLPGRIGAAASGMFNGIADAFRSAMNMIIDMWDSLGFTLPAINWGPLHLGGGRLEMPHIPHLDAGGIALSPMLAEIGHGANGEAVVPLPAGGLGGLGGGTITVTVPLIIDGRQFAKATAQFTRAELLQGTARSTGKVGLG